MSNSIRPVLTVPGDVRYLGVLDGEPVVGGRSGLHHGSRRIHSQVADRAVWTGSEFFWTSGTYPPRLNGAELDYGDTNGLVADGSGCVFLATGEENDWILAAGEVRWSSAVGDRRSRLLDLVLRGDTVATLIDLETTPWVVCQDRSDGAVRFSVHTQIPGFACSCRILVTEAGFLVAGAANDASGEPHAPVLWAIDADGTAHTPIVLHSELPASIDDAFLDGEGAVWLLASVDDVQSADEAIGGTTMLGKVDGAEVIWRVLPGRRFYAKAALDGGTLWFARSDDDGAHVFRAALSAFDGWLAHSSMEERRQTR